MEMPAVLEITNLPSHEEPPLPHHQEPAESHGHAHSSEEGAEHTSNTHSSQEGAGHGGDTRNSEEGAGRTSNTHSSQEGAEHGSDGASACTNTNQELCTGDGTEASPPNNGDGGPESSTEAPNTDPEEPPPSSESLPDTDSLPHRTPETPPTQSQEAEPGPDTTDKREDGTKAPEVEAPGEENGRSKHGPKRVTFPCDDDIVSGALEPKDPWRHAQNVTVEDVVASYTLACQKLNCKQIPKLIRQLQEITDLSGRVESLELKGEKLDHKACEALEEIFKRVQFKMVDLEQTSLDEDGASALFDMIEYYESATHLNISFNKHIGTRGWQAAAHMMRKTNCLQYLDARNTPLLDHSAPFVARALRISSSLTILHLENTSLSGRPLMLLATALKMNIVLRELYLADNRLNSLQDSAQLGNLLKFNGCIQILDLRNNHIMDSGLAYICEGLKEQRQGLVTLVLWNNQLTHAGMVYMSMCLPHTLTLETLNLGHNAIGNEGVRHLKNGLIGNRSVLRLGLASAKLNCEGAVAVAEFVAESPRLLRLDLRENEIKTGGLMALSLALRVNQSLLRLDLDREPKKEAVKSFIETQKALLAEIQNGCRRNFVLAKEKEERLQQSASMPEIACAAEEEDSNPAPEENSQPSEETSNTSEAPAPEEPQQPEDQTSPAPDSQGQDSDSDTEDEEVEEEKPPVEIKPVVETIPIVETKPVEEIKPAENSIQRPPGPVAVSSPGRGHKIFLVTRVENPNTTGGGGKASQDGKGSTMTGVASPGGPGLANGIDSERDKRTTCCDNKDSFGTYTDTEVEDLLRDASSEPDPSLNAITL